MASLMTGVASAGAVGLVIRALAVVLTFVVVRFVYRGVQVRLRFKRMARHGIPIMPHSWLLGHISLIIQFRKDFPPDLHVSMFQVEVMKRYKKYFPDLESPPRVVYLDVWPLGTPICFSVDPAVSSQFTQTKSLPKGDMVGYLLRPLCDDRDLVSLEGNEWKLWRSRFNPGFSARNIMALVPTILEELDIFIHQLEKQAGPDGTWGDVFQLEQKAMNLTFDVIGRAALDVKFNEQSRPEPSGFKNAFFSQLSFMVMGASISSITARHLPAYARVKAENDKVMDDFLVPYVQQRDNVVKKQDLSKSAASEKFIIDLALKSIQKDGGSSQLHSQPDGLLMKTLLSQLKVFLFAGHDTTASTIAWAFHLLSRHPKTLEKLRAEHDSVFGSSVDDIEQTSSQIAASPHLLNQIPYTVAVVKETLRLQPPASSWRQGQPGFFLSVPGSEIPYPTEGFLVNDTVRTLQQHSESWERPGEFVPERFLVEGDEGNDDVKIQPPPVNGWRPFVHGPRNCIGQELAMVELKLVLVLVARRFDVECAWDKWDATQEKAGITHEKWAYEGDRLYPYGESTAHCKDNMPAHVRLRSVS